ncbi:MAG: acyltransferase family protein [Alphaproteobacteria bacterium]|nr:acyltransferase family protein [Alphaproteobacteria bacterium]
MQRLPYLDALRSFAMIFGVFLHASVLREGWDHEVLSFLSARFRMPLFFLISGFFAAMLLTRRGSGPFVRWRLVVLGVPLLFGLVVLNPLAFYLIDKFNGGTAGLFDIVTGAVEARAKPTQVWHLHLWFLISLSVYVLAAPVLMWVLNLSIITRCLHWLADRRTGLCVVILAAMVAVWEVLVRGAWSALSLAEVLPGAQFLVTITLIYAFYFALGMAAFYVRDLFEALHRWALVWLALGIVGGLALGMVADMLPSPVAVILQIGFRTLSTIAFIMVLMAAFRAFIPAQSRVAYVMNTTIYTVYLLHYLVIYLLAVTVFGGVTNPYILHLLTALTALGIGIAVHFGLVQNSRVASFLLNGTSQPRKAVAKPA